jgi:glutamine synthetase
MVESATAREAQSMTSTPPGSGNLTLDELNRLIDKRDIDTVIVAFADMQGRLVGKRVVP